MIFLQSQISMRVQAIALSPQPQKPFRPTYSCYMESSRAMPRHELVNSFEKRWSSSVLTRISIFEGGSWLQRQRKIKPLRLRRALDWKISLLILRRFEIKDHEEYATSMDLHMQASAALRDAKSRLGHLGIDFTSVSQECILWYRRQQIIFRILILESASLTFQYRSSQMIQTRKWTTSLFPEDSVPESTPSAPPTLTHSNLPQITMLS